LRRLALGNPEHQRAYGEQLAAELAVAEQGWEATRAAMTWDALASFPEQEATAPGVNSWRTEAASQELEPLLAESQQLQERLQREQPGPRRAALLEAKIRVKKRVRRVIAKHRHWQKAGLIRAAQGAEGQQAGEKWAAFHGLAGRTSKQLLKVRIIKNR
jgi:hypothetical protein